MGVAEFLGGNSTTIALTLFEDCYKPTKKREAESMDIRNEKEKQDNRKLEEYKRTPTINLADSINRSMIGDPGELTRGSCLTRVITTVIIIGIIVFLFLYLH